MKRNPSSLHLFLTLVLLVGLLFGAFGQPLVMALGEKAGTIEENNAVPAPVSFTLQDPASSPTNADALTFRVTFSEPVFGVDDTDFAVVFTPPPLVPVPGLTVTRINTRVYDVRIYGGDLPDYNGVVGLDFSVAAIIFDAFDNPIPIIEPPIDQTYLVDNTNPTVTIDQAVGQSDPAITAPVVFMVVFDEEIDVATFTASDITQSGDAPSPVWSIVDSGNHKTFTLSVTTAGNGTLNPTISAGRVKDLVGNGNYPFVKGCDNLSPDNCVTLNDTTRPTVTITQAVGQPDPATTQPVVFTAVFSEEINVPTFSASDITDVGDAPLPVWSIADTGDHKTFTLTATTTGNGLIIPAILAGKVLDPAGNSNLEFLGDCNIPAFDNCVTVAETTRPTVTINQAVGQLDPAATQPVVFTVVFSEEINTGTFAGGDITQLGTAPSPGWTILDSGDHKTFTLSARTTANGTIRPYISAGKVFDLFGNGNYPSTGADDTVTLADGTRPTVNIEQAPPPQADPAHVLPVKFTVTFNEEINVTTFTASDITQTGTALSPVWTIAATNDHKTFNLSVTVAGDGTIIPVIAAGLVSDLVGNGNALSGGTDNSVTYLDIPPSVTVEQASGQPDPAGTLPVRFTVTFSEPINASTFTRYDIKQNGTAAEILWGIADSGDHKVFTLTAISTDGYGTLIPSIPAGKVQDVFGTYNFASTSADNSVTYAELPTATPTATPPQEPFKSVVITEVAWMGTVASSSDEWIELYNATDHRILLDGWELRSFYWDSANTRWALNLNIKFTSSDYIDPRTSTDPDETDGYYLLQRGFSLTDYDAIQDNKFQADKIYTTYLLRDSGEVLLLCSRQNIDQGKCYVDYKNQLVDYVNASWTSPGSNPWPAGKGSPTYGSMERKNLISDEDTNWFTHTLTPPRYGHNRNWDGHTYSTNLITGTPKHPNWAFEVTATPGATVTPTRTPTKAPGAAPILVINEVLARAGSDWNNDGKVDVYDEFIEVMNSGTVNVSLSNFKLDDALNSGSAPFSLPNQTLIPGEIVVFYGSQTGIRLEDSGDTVNLIRSSNNSVIDAVTYPVVKSVDSSICRYTDGYGSWITHCFPTPGRPNALTGDRYPSSSNGIPILVCFLPDSTPEEIVLAECGEGQEGLGIWNYSYWDSFPGEGKEIWLFDPDDKWPVVYQ